MLADMPTQEGTNIQLRPTCSCVWEVKGQDDCDSVKCFYPIDRCLHLDLWSGVDRLKAIPEVR